MVIYPIGFDFLLVDYAYILLSEFVSTDRVLESRSCSNFLLALGRFPCVYEKEEITFFDISNASAQDLVDGGCRTSPAFTPPLGARGELKSSGKVFSLLQKTFPELSATLFLADSFFSFGQILTFFTR